ncbi:ATP-binding protein [Heyndrickxia oleronia]|uniref:histidine kinase n=1 Tax=Heyndrickxia oleronia TaxID=38875 RepID=A0AAW6SPR8_9BACI|nr:ATP-binding protein [Heyndrickxia oleronia]MCM3239155.1 ATP-binding protein [Heyndrickxia oleronia]MCM3452837.1 ATP-binding protein [Heyndrickxia oleronia]MDH5160826.1 ATP-binding protein [Heyndrickxia oleronia]
MKELNQLSNLKWYKIIVLFIICMMASGIIISPAPIFSIQKMIQLLFTVTISIVFFIYPKKETFMFKGILIYLIAGYFYSLFLLYPETTLNFVFITVLPCIAIAFFHKKIYYSIGIVNLIGGYGIFAYIYFIDQGERFPYFLEDYWGNIINFTACQFIFFFVFFITNSRTEKLKLYYEQIQRTERLKNTGQLAAAVAHEIRNPITVVKGFLQFYEEDQLIPMKSKQHFQLMLDELDLAEKVISDFLSLAKPNTEKTPVSNVNDTVHSVVELLSSYASANNIIFSLSIHDNINVHCSKVEMKQLLVNFIKNAIEATDKKDGIIKISTELHESKLHLLIEDNGIGMDNEEIEKIGTPFYSLKSNGTGLGLMICYNIIENYNGSIKFSSEKGKGTKVTIQFQIAR